MPVIGLIPARLQSTRLPRKLLLDATGRPLIQYVWEAARRTESLNDVIIATDNLEIASAVRSFGGRAVMTGDHPSGTDRIAEVVRKHCEAADIVVNLQGDEPELDPEQIDRLVATLQQNPGDEMATLATPLRTADDVRDPNCVKVVCARDGRALYFSRSPIPSARDHAIDDYFQASIGRKPYDDAGERDASFDQRHQPADAGCSPSPWLLHLGLYAYRREFLLRLTQLSPSPLEQLEKLEQLRALEAGATIRVATVENANVGIDTPEDYARFVTRQSKRAA